MYFWAQTEPLREEIWREEISNFQPICEFRGYLAGIYFGGRLWFLLTLAS